MSQEIKCPQCGGNKLKRFLDSYKCMYCGTEFRPIEEAPQLEQPVQSVPTTSNIPTYTSSNVNVTVNIPNDGSGNVNRRGNENNFTKGAAQGAGVVAGGCLTSTAIILAIPFLLFLALLSMCS